MSRWETSTELTTASKVLDGGFDSLISHQRSARSHISLFSQGFTYDYAKGLEYKPASTTSATLL